MRSSLSFTASRTSMLPDSDSGRTATKSSVASAPIAVVVSQLGYGGAERQTVELLRGLANSPLRPRVVVCLSKHTQPYGTAISGMGYPLEVIERGASYDLARVLHLRRTLSKHRIRLVHAVHLLASGYVWLATRLNSDACVMLPTFRGATAQASWLKNALYSRLLRNSGAVLVNSHCGADYLRSHFAVDPNKTHVVPNGLDVAQLVAASVGPTLHEELDIEGPIVGFVGRRAPIKNVPRFLKITEQLLERMPQVHAVLVGDGLDDNARGALAPHLPREQVHFLGPRRDAPRILRSLDVLVLTSDSEGCPNVVLEACALGTPVVASNVGDVQRILQLIGGGTVVPPARIDRYVSAVIRTLSDTRLSDSTINARRVVVERTFGLTTMVGDTARLWMCLLQQTHPIPTGNTTHAEA